MVFSEKSAIDVQKRNQESDQSSHSHLRNQESFAVVWLNRQHTLTHVQQTLSQSDQQQGVAFLAVVACQFSQNIGKTRVVRSRTNQTEADNSAVRNLSVGVIGQFVEQVHDVDFGIGETEHCQGKGNNSLLLRF